MAGQPIIKHTSQLLHLSKSTCLWFFRILFITAHLPLTMTIESTLIGTGLDVKPSVYEIPIEPGITVIAPSSGLLKAGIEYGQVFDFYTSLSAIFEDQQPTSNEIADTLLKQAISVDQGQPNEDMSVIVLRIFSGVQNKIRRINVNIPILDLD